MRIFSFMHVARSSTAVDVGAPDDTFFFVLVRRKVSAVGGAGARNSAPLLHRLGFATAYIPGRLCVGPWSSKTAVVQVLGGSWCSITALSTTTGRCACSSLE